MSSSVARRARLEYANIKQRAFGFRQVCDGVKKVAESRYLFQRTRRPNQRRLGRARSNDNLSNSVLENGSHGGDADTASRQDDVIHEVWLNLQAPVWSADVKSNIINCYLRFSHRVHGLNELTTPLLDALSKPLDEDGDFPRLWVE